MSRWIEMLQKREKKIHIPPCKTLTKPTKAPSVSSVSALPVGIEKNQPVQSITKMDVIHIRGGHLDTDIWVVPDGWVDDPGSNVYTDSEILELAQLNPTPDVLRAIHLVKTTFEGCVKPAYSIPTEILSNTPVEH